MPGVVTVEKEIEIKAQYETKLKVMKQDIHSFEEDYEKCYKKFNLFSKEPLVIGRYEDYGGAILDTGNSRIFVHDNVVYRQCTKSLSHC